jgi:DNA-binding HxlR family transcriptional regulator
MKKYTVCNCGDRSDCPVNLAISLVSNKWKDFIIRYLLDGKKRFGELQRDITGISQKVLTDNLRQMEKDGLLTRKVYAEVPPHVEYQLSELGESFCEVLESVAQWGLHYQKLVRDGKIKSVK